MAHTDAIPDVDSGVLNIAGLMLQSVDLILFWVEHGAARADWENEAPVGNSPTKNYPLDIPGKLQKKIGWCKLNELFSKFLKKLLNYRTIHYSIFTRFYY